MPVVEIAQVGRQTWRGLWHITEDLPALGEEDPPPDVAHPKKKMEWKATRLLAREVCAVLAIPFRGIIYDGKRKPYLAGAAHEISVAHSFPWASVIISSDRAGIDIERPSQKLKTVAPRFLSAQEYQTIGVGNLETLCVYWCAKEALYKFHAEKNIIFRENLFVQPLGDIADKRGDLRGIIRVGDSEQVVMLRYETRPDFVMAFTLPPI